MTYASIEWSRELSDLFQDAEYWWRESKGFGEKLKIGKMADGYKGVRFEDGNRFIDYHPAITLEMALDKLPNYFKVSHDAYEADFNVVLVMNKNTVSYRNENFGYHVTYKDKSLVEACCKMISHLRREGYYK